MLLAHRLGAHARLAWSQSEPEDAAVALLAHQLAAGRVVTARQTCDSRRLQCKAPLQALLDDPTLTSNQPLSHVQERWQSEVDLHSKGLSNYDAALFKQWGMGYLVQHALRMGQPYRYGQDITEAFLRLMFLAEEPLLPPLPLLCPTTRDVLKFWSRLSLWNEQSCEQRVLTGNPSVAYVLDMRGGSLQAGRFQLRVLKAGPNIWGPVTGLRMDMLMGHDCDMLAREVMSNYAQHGLRPMHIDFPHTSSRECVAKALQLAQAVQQLLDAQTTSPSPTHMCLMICPVANMVVRNWLTADGPGASADLKAALHTATDVGQLVLIPHQSSSVLVHLHMLTRSSDDVRGHTGPRSGPPVSGSGLAAMSSNSSPDRAPHTPDSHPALGLPPPPAGMVDSALLTAVRMVTRAQLMHHARAAAGWPDADAASPPYRLPPWAPGLEAWLWLSWAAALRTLRAGWQVSAAVQARLRHWSICSVPGTGSADAVSGLQVVLEGEQLAALVMAHEHSRADLQEQAAARARRALGAVRALTGPTAPAAARELYMQAVEAEHCIWTVPGDTELLAHQLRSRALAGGRHGPRKAFEWLLTVRAVATLRGLVACVPVGLLLQLLPRQLLPNHALGRLAAATRHARAAGGPMPAAGVTGAEVGAEPGLAQGEELSELRDAVLGATSGISVLAAREAGQGIVDQLPETVLADMLASYGVRGLSTP